MKNNRKPYEKLVLFPRSLSLEEQGKFMLGYYHQTQKKYEKRRTNKWERLLKTDMSLLFYLMLKWKS